MGGKFVKGDPRINREGRPLGAVDKKWHDIKWWFSLVSENSDKLTPKEKVDAGLRGMALLISRIPALPKDADESVANADATFKMMKELNAAGLPTDHTRV